MRGADAVVHRGFIPPPVPGLTSFDANVVGEMRLALVARSRELQAELQRVQSPEGERDWTAVDQLQARTLEVSEWLLWLDRYAGGGLAEHDGRQSWRSGESAPTSPMDQTDAERIALQRATVEIHMQGENDHDWESVHGTFVRDDRAHWDAMPMGQRVKGFEGVKDFYQTMERAFPNAGVEVTHAYDVIGTSIREVTISGTHVGEYAGIPANGNPYRYEAIGVYVFGTGIDAGRLIAERVYFDQQSVLRQLRGDADAVVGGIGLASER